MSYMLKSDRRVRFARRPALLDMSEDIIRATMPLESVGQEEALSTRGWWSDLFFTTSKCAGKTEYNDLEVREGSGHSFIVQDSGSEAIFLLFCPATSTYAKSDGTEEKSCRAIPFRKISYSGVFCLSPETYWYLQHEECGRNDSHNLQ